MHSLQKAEVSCVISSPLNLWTLTSTKKSIPTSNC